MGKIVSQKLTSSVSCVPSCALPLPHARPPPPPLALPTLLAACHIACCRRHRRIHLQLTQRTQLPITLCHRAHGCSHRRGRLDLPPCPLPRACGQALPTTLPLGVPCPRRAHLHLSQRIQLPIALRRRAHCRCHRRGRLHLPHAQAWAVCDRALVATGASSDSSHVMLPFVATLAFL